MNRARAFLLRLLSVEGRVWAFAFFAAMLLTLLLDVNVLPNGTWSRALLLAALSFATLGLALDAVIWLRRRRSGKSPGASSAG